MAECDYGKYCMCQTCQYQQGCKEDNCNYCFDCLREKKQIHDVWHCTRYMRKEQLRTYGT